ncbi:MAG: type II toxin-antitoxin system VapC family toxin [Hyphomonadaceae bacterium]|nr:type II toxin-antitoxin system VapC family toxin [Hyphomonadaceae bacterium]
MVYFDTSALLPLFLTEGTTPAVHTFVATVGQPLIISEWAVTEFSSALSLRVRVKSIAAHEADAVNGALDALLAANAPIALARIDFHRARSFVADAALNIRAGDALHLAAAERLGAMLATFDRGLMQAARSIGLPCAAIS